MKKRIMIDLDEVIVKNVWINAVNKFFNRNYKIDCEEDIFDILTDDELKSFYEYIGENDHYMGAEMLDGAKRVIERLCIDYDVYIVSAYQLPRHLEMSSNNLKAKFDFIMRELPFFDKKNIILSNRKNIMNFDIKIDDRIDNLGGNAMLKLLMTEHRNMDIGDEELEELGIIRVDNWDEVEKIIYEN